MVGGTTYEIKGGRTRVGGTGYGVFKGRTLVSGAGYDLGFMATNVLGAQPEGGIVLINENGIPVEFYVAKHDYEPSLNGNGRTLVVRKDPYDQRPWDAYNVNAYASSTIDAWLNGEYRAALDADIRYETGSTTFYYTPGNGNVVMTTLSRSVFLLSVGELCGNDRRLNTEGSVLPTAEILKFCYANGSAVRQWTRSCVLTDNTSVPQVNEFVYITNCSVSDHWSRPAFTLPSILLVDDDGYVSVAT